MSLTDTLVGTRSGTQHISDSIKMLTEENRKLREEIVLLKQESSVLGNRMFWLTVVLVVLTIIMVIPIVSSLIQWLICRWS